MNNNINMKPPVYDEAAVKPYRDELLFLGFKELKTPQNVEETLSAGNNQSILYIINSVCGCAAGSARPGAALALQNSKIPDMLVTSFAGMERDAIEYLRENYLNDFPPSSPCIALFKEGELKLMLQRFQIESSSPEELAETLINHFNEHCSKKGPSVSLEEYNKLISAQTCGSSISLN